MTSLHPFHPIGPYMVSMQPLSIMMLIFLEHLLMCDIYSTYNPVTCINFVLTIQAFWYCLFYHWVILSSRIIIEIA